MLHLASQVVVPSSSSDSESDDEKLNFGQLQDVSKKPHILSNVVKKYYY